MLLSSKLPGVGTSIFTIMSAMANEHGAINLAQGFPDFDCSDRLKGLVEKYMRLGHNQYAPMPGVPALRNIVAEKIRSLYGLSVYAMAQWKAYRQHELEREIKDD